MEQTSQSWTLRDSGQPKESMSLMSWDGPGNAPCGEEFLKPLKEEEKGELQTPEKPRGQPPPYGSFRETKGLLLLSHTILGEAGV